MRAARVITDAMPADTVAMPVGIVAMRAVTVAWLVITTAVPVCTFVGLAIMPIATACTIRDMCATF